jgi:hypothetical protein
MPLLDGVPPIAGQRERPLRKPQCVQADRGYDCEAYWRILRERGIWLQIGKRLTEHGSHLGLTRWVGRAHVRLAAPVSLIARTL